MLAFSFKLVCKTAFRSLHNFSLKYGGSVNLYVVFDQVSAKLKLPNNQKVVFQQLVSRAGSSIEARLAISLRLTAFVEIEKKWYIWEIKDASVGLKLQGSVSATLDLKVGGELRLVIHNKILIVGLSQCLINVQYIDIYI